MRRSGEQEYQLDDFNREMTLRNVKLMKILKESVNGDKIESADAHGFGELMIH